MTGIAQLSNAHHAIMEYLMVHPNVSLGAVAKEFNYTQAWLSCVINSDCFQDALKEKRDVLFHHTILPIKDKMVALASRSLDRMLERIPLETDSDIIRKTTEGVLDRLGYGTKTAAPGGLNINAQNVQLNVLRSEIEEAKSLLGQTQRPMLGVETNGVRAAVEVSTKSPAAVGQVHKERPFHDFETLVASL